MPEIKRTLAEAMRIPKITPEALAIIKGGTPVSQTVPASDALANEPKPAVQKAKSQTRISKDKPISVEPYVPLTARVPMRIPQALLKAASMKDFRLDRLPRNCFKFHPEARGQVKHRFLHTMTPPVVTIGR